MIIVKTRRGPEINSVICIKLPNTTSGDSFYIMYWNPFLQRYMKIA